MADPKNRKSSNLSRRELILGAGSAGLFLKSKRLHAESVAPRNGQQGSVVVFANTTVVNPDTVHNNVALAVEGSEIVAIGSTEEVLELYPQAEVYDGTHKALLPGLINCHAHMGAVIARGFNEDFGFPNTANLSISPNSLLEGEEDILMVKVAALEAIKTGTTTIVENTGNILRDAAALAATGLRCVFAESVRDAENVRGPMTPEAFSQAEPPKFSARLRDEGMQRIHDLFSTWHGAEQGRISVFPAAGLTETSSPELLGAIRNFAEENDVGYTIH